jgi:putrescine importer
VTLPAQSQSSVAGGPRLRRVLTLWDLVLYGIVVISPAAPMPIFGVISQRGHGHAAATVGIAMFAMLLTAISYGRMARAYPSAGSAFTYVGREINPALGYITGWGMVMDYMVGPLICIIWCSQQAHIFVPAIPYRVWVIGFVSLFTGLNVQGIRNSARVNMILTAGMGIVITIFFVAATFYIFNHSHADAGFFTRPFYDPQTFTWRGALSGTSLAVLTYLGFDGISTLAEEAENPRRHILPATVLTCLAIGLLSIAEVYAAQLVWPASEPYPNLDTAFTFVAQRIWAPLFGLVGLMLVISNVGSGLGAQLGAARLLYGMGRSGVLPGSFFGTVDPKRHVPRNNVLCVGAFALGGAFLLPVIAGEATGYELGANLVNFGALVAFMGVNAATFVRYYLRADHRRLRNFVPPVLGFFVCLLLWWNLSAQARMVGFIWMAIGIAFGAWKTRGFRSNLVVFELPPETVQDVPPQTQQTVRHLQDISG